MKTWRVEDPNAQIHIQAYDLGIAKLLYILTKLGLRTTRLRYTLKHIAWGSKLIYIWGTLVWEPRRSSLSFCVSPFPSLSESVAWSGAFKLWCVKHGEHIACTIASKSMMQLMAQEAWAAHSLHHNQQTYDTNDDAYWFTLLPKYVACDALASKIIIQFMTHKALTANSQRRTIQMMTHKAWSAYSLHRSQQRDDDRYDACLLSLSPKYVARDKLTSLSTKHATD